MTLLAVTGYASVDYAVGLSGQIRGDHTTLIDHRDTAKWPRLGGCPAYVAVAAANAGMASQPVTWIGNDNHAQVYLDGLASAGVGTDGVARLERPSPMAILAYQDDGSCACLFDPVFPGEEILTGKQAGIIASASHTCISVGPPHLTGEILEHRSPAARLYWICKNDAHAFPPPVRTSLSANADVIFCSRSERQLVGKTREGAIIIETRGAAGVQVEHCGKRELIMVEPVEVRDTTGAGDTLAGGYIAAEMAGQTDPRAAVTAGIEAVRAMLVKRTAGDRR